MNKPKLFYGWYMVAASWIMLFLVSAVAISIFFKPMLEEFGWDRATLSSVQSVSLIVFTIMAPFLGRLVDKFGPRVMLAVCVATQTLSSLINGIAASIWHLYLARLFYHIKPFESSQILVTRWFSRKRGTALGLVATGVPIGSIILTPISQFLIIEWGWRTTMLFWAAVTLVVTLPLILFFRNSPEEKGLKVDGDSPDKAGTTGPPEKQNQIKPVAEIEENVKYTFTEAFRNRMFWFIGSAQFICGLGCGFIMTHIVIFTTDMGYPDMIAASLVSVQGALNLVGLLVTGFFSDRVARKKVLGFTHIIRSISFVLSVIFIIIGGQPLVLLYIAIAFFGFGWFTTAPLSVGLLAEIYGDFRIGTILGFMTAFHMLGMALGAYAGGAIFELTGSYYLYFLVQGPLEIIAAIFVLSVRPLRKRERALG
jgi:MFS family permease